MNRYFEYTDDRVDELEGLEVPKAWWSRPFEYAYCLKQIKKTDLIIDIGCGIEHPFKDWAKTRARKTYAIDTDERINKFESDTKIAYRHGEFERFNFKGVKFDKFFLIGVLNNMPNKNIEDIFLRISDMIKANSKVYITADYPLACFRNIIKIAKKYKLEPTSEFKNVIDASNILSSKQGNMILKTFCLELQPISKK